jgi:hypothetical protein
MFAPLSSPEILWIWEQGSGLSPAERAALLLSCALSERHSPLAPERLAQVSLAERDFALAKLRQQTFGDRLPCMADCPDCAERLEFEVGISELWQGSPREAPPDEWVDDEYRVQLRLPTCGDMADAAGCPDVESAARLITARAIVAVERAGRAVAVADLPEQVKLRVERHLEASAPGLATTLDLKCVACGTRWQLGFDIAVHLWSDICGQAQRLLRQVAQLASLFGWSESDILAMSAGRRQAYLTLGSVA